MTTTLTTEAQLLADWLYAEARLAAEFYAVESSDYDDLNAKGRQVAARLGIDWCDRLELLSRNQWDDSPQAAEYLATANKPRPDIGEVVLCAHRGEWLIVDGMEDDGSVYLHGDGYTIGPVPLTNLTNLGPTVGRFWMGNSYATGNHWDLLHGEGFSRI